MYITRDSQSMYVMYDSVLLCVGSAEGRARCQLDHVHNWDRSCPDQVLACACMRGEVWSARTGVAPVAPADSSPV